MHGGLRVRAVPAARFPGRALLQRNSLHHSSVPQRFFSAVSKDDVLAVQSKWAKTIETISATQTNGGDFVQTAADAAGELYAYGHTEVLFKPTMASEYQFRPTPKSAISYFIGGSNVDGGYDEDDGFAINGGKGWSKCVYDNHNIVIKSDIALAMGNYYFTCATTNEETKAEYTFGYIRCNDGVVRIFLHHSSLPHISNITSPFPPNVGDAKP